MVFLWFSYGFATTSTQPSPVGTPGSAAEMRAGRSTGSAVTVSCSEARDSVTETSWRMGQEDQAAPCSDVGMGFHGWWMMDGLLKDENWPKKFGGRFGDEWSG